VRDVAPHRQSYAKLSPEALVELRRRRGLTSGKELRKELGVSATTLEQLASGGTVMDRTVERLEKELLRK